MTFNRLTFIFSFLFSFVIFIHGCNTNLQSNHEKITFNQVTKYKPISQFIQFIKKIESDGWISDTARINKVKLYGLQEYKIQRYNQYPFYNISFEHSYVRHFVNGDNIQEKKTKTILSKTKQIWAYFYRKKDAKYIICDGVIEQWSYGDSIAAQSAFKEFKKYGDYIYFNTIPYFYQIKNSVFIFHTRAMAFSYPQKDLYEKFVTSFTK